jgi:hypothetical protein
MGQVGPRIAYGPPLTFKSADDRLVALSILYHMKMFKTLLP